MRATDQVWATTISTGLLLAVLGYVLTDLRGLRSRFEDKIDELKTGISAIGERVARLESRVDALEHWMQAYGIHEDTLQRVLDALQDRGGPPRG